MKYQNLEELKAAMEQDRKQEKLDWAELPIFGGEEPESTMGIWSWDDDRLLITNSVGDLEIVSRDEWEDRR